MTGTVLPSASVASSGYGPAVSSSGRQVLVSLRSISSPPPPMATSTPEMEASASTSSSTCCRWLMRMILLTPASVSVATSALTASATADTTALRGAEIAPSIGVMAPMTPILSPPVSTTVLRARRPASTIATSAGSADTSRLADRNTTGGSKPPKNSAATSGPKSMSWLPTAMASYRPLRPMES